MNAPEARVGSTDPRGPRHGWNDSVPLDSSYWAGLLQHEVHLWLFRLDSPPHPLRSLARLLGEDERRRAARFVFETDRKRFVAGRGMLRTLLGRYIGVAPERVAFEVTAEGKPSVSSVLPEVSIDFNLSHSGGWALLGVTRGRTIGVDIEAHREMPDAEQIARSHFSPAEMLEFMAAPSEERTAAFFACWTRKEAYVKATGLGLSMRLDRFEVSFRAGDLPRLRSIEGSTMVASEWSLWNCDVGDDMAAAVVVHGTELSLRQLLLT
ncbi:MAG: 4'-phosphopantetheinyl transferase superfamily protein [Burkholderiaceae bacterium]